MKEVLNSRIAPAAWLAAVLALLVPNVSAQSGPFRKGAATLTGEVFSDNGNPPSGLSIELLGLGSTNFSSHTPLNPDHRFVLLDVPVGAYELRVVDRSGSVLRRDIVSVTEPGSHIDVHLPKREVARSSAETVSVARLRHHPAPKAQKEFDKAITASEMGDTESAIEHLHKAIAIDPDYMEPHNNLGVCLLRKTQYAEAAEQFERATELDPSAELAWANLGIAYAGLRRFEEAEEAARKSLRLSPSSNSSRYILGLALDAQHREPKEALANLEAAARQIPNARLAAARILAREGQNAQAASHLRKYLSSGAAGNRDQVRTWLAKLEK